MTPRRAFTIQARVGRDRRAATQQQILDAVKRLLERGAAVAALSVDRIAEEAEVSRSTFYLHFRDKRELIARLADQEMRDLRAIVAPLLEDPAAGRDALEPVVREIVAQWRVHAPVVSGIIELGEYDAGAREAWQAAVHGVAATVADYLRARWAGRPPPQPDPDDVARLMAWMTERACHQLLRDADPLVEQRIAGALTETLWRIVEPGSA